ncbi:uncharacterized protein B0H18DRAFT_558014 [Fomitopsis serialis]|uniref:uncharacterized protein n=1 Tax=Fomitopsis serialis TaxID=139415 RepID=UPI0020084DE8|nr:uncharacterized protein B0H18DRAFT_558014 [Neoantrodia serialis]KAH9934392.1 hypothetical protein B0H18DRAFT_558014 [Neoantrodia serialis]
MSRLLVPKASLAAEIRLVIFLLLSLRCVVYRYGTGYNALANRGLTTTSNSLACMFWEHLSLLRSQRTLSLITTQSRMFLVSHMEGSLMTRCLCQMSEASFYPCSPSRIRTSRMVLGTPVPVDIGSPLRVLVLPSFRDGCLKVGPPMSELL